MIAWRDRGLLLAVRRHGEGSAILDTLTEAHGRHAGLVRGGASAKKAPILQPGAELDLAWSARIAEHLGTFQAEPLRLRAASLMADRGRLAAFNAMAALILAFVPERAPDPGLFTLSTGLADTLAEGASDWPLHYVAWELGFLAALGFRLDLSRCAATGSTDDLVWVSPKSGRAVSREGGRGWEDRLLALPDFLQGRTPAPEDADRGLRLTGHFLTHWALPAVERPTLPDARARLIQSLRQRS